MLLSLVKKNIITVTKSNTKQERVNNKGTDGTQVSQWAHHGQTTLKQRCIDVTEIDTTLFRRRLTMTCPLGYKHNHVEVEETISFPGRITFTLGGR